MDKELEKLIGHPLKEVLQSLPLYATIVVIGEFYDVESGTGFEKDELNDEAMVKDLLNPDTEAYADIEEALNYPMTDYGIYNYSDDSTPDRYDIYVKEVK